MGHPYRQAWRDVLENRVKCCVGENIKYLRDEFKILRKQARPRLPSPIDATMSMRGTTIHCNIYQMGPQKSR